MLDAIIKEIKLGNYILHENRGGNHMHAQLKEDIRLLEIFIDNYLNYHLEVSPGDGKYILPSTFSVN